MRRFSVGSNNPQKDPRLGRKGSTVSHCSHPFAQHRGHAQGFQISEIDHCPACVSSTCPSTEHSGAVAVQTVSQPLHRKYRCPKVQAGRAVCGSRFVSTHCGCRYSGAQPLSPHSSAQLVLVLTGPELCGPSAEAGVSHSCCPLEHTQVLLMLPWEVRSCPGDFEIGSEGHDACGLAAAACRFLQSTAYHPGCHSTVPSGA